LQAVGITDLGPRPRALRLGNSICQATKLRFPWRPFLRVFVTILLSRHKIILVKHKAVRSCLVELHETVRIMTTV
jgi:hypothetical protein